MFLRKVLVDSQKAIWYSTGYNQEAGAVVEKKIPFWELAEKDRNTLRGELSWFATVGFIPFIALGFAGIANILDWIGVV